MMQRFHVAPFVLSLLIACGPETDTGRPRKDGGADSGVGQTECKKPPSDDDGDGISDANEGFAEQRDTDADGTPDYQDLDSDNDGIPDEIEGRTFGNTCNPPVDSDDDGKPDFRDLDSDSPTNATVGDKEEAGASPGMPVDTDQDGTPDYRDDDNDGDGIPDIFELTQIGSAVGATKLVDAPDSDTDGIPDFMDMDSDNDSILDKDEGAVDTDGDLTPNYRDVDSDGDCIPDAFEAGDTNLDTPPVDTDMDGAPDFQDKDSDADGYKDKSEDLNCNGITDPCESNRLLADTDGDGTNDLIESLSCSVKPAAVQAALNCKCDATDPAQTPLTRGDFVFIVDYQKPPVPDVDTLSLSSDLSQADVIFSLDTTGSMSACLNNLAGGLAGIVPTLKSRVPNIAFGVVEFRDYGDAVKVAYRHRIQTANVLMGAQNPSLNAAVAALDALTASGGGDGSEAGWSALWAIASSTKKNVQYTAGGAVFTVGFDLPSTPPNPPTTGETQGNLYGAGFRPGSVPIVVTATDVNWHDGVGTVASGENGIDPYPNSYCTPCTNVPTRQETIDALLAIGARVVGLAAIPASSTTGNPKSRAIGTAQATAAVVKPDDFGTALTGRPASCAAGKCCTGHGGASEEPIGGECPLAFSVDSATGNGVTTSVANGIIALANGLILNVYVQARDVDPSTVDRFVEKLVPNLSPNAQMCITMTASPLQDNYTGPKALTMAPDGILDTFPGVKVGQKICFDVHPKQNDVVMNTEEPQLFRAQLLVKGRANNNTFDLGQPREVFFLVPPVIVNGPLM